MTRGALAFFFFLSGACSLVYETVWLRLAMGAFGVTAPAVSVFLSVFMGGLGVGSLLGGALTRRGKGGERAALRAYGLCELAVGAGALLVPAALRACREALDRPLGGVAWGSTLFYAASGVLLAALLAPACLAMGATIPLAMAAAERADERGRRGSFSFLYAANVVGAAAGTLGAAYVLIELLGFSNTGRLAAAGNGLIGLGALALASRAPRTAAAPAQGKGARVGALGASGPLLFSTGLVSMGMEVVWLRQFTPYLGTTIYTFATVLAVYLLATFAGSYAYRRRAWDQPLLWLAAGPLAALSAAAANPYLPLPALARVVLGVAPLSAALGYLTPALVEEGSGGDPALAGRAYAVNVAGCILGPLLAGFVLLPRLPADAALGALALPLFAAGAALGRRRAVLAGLCLASAALLATADSFSDWIRGWRGPVVVARDYQADVVAAGPPQALLVVNGSSMTNLDTVTKVMAHLPLAALGGSARRALVICFGMGTTFRSMRTWGVDVTAVELVPSVPLLFPVFHADAAQVLASPAARLVVDDGRRYLARGAEPFDVITVDPAPPLNAAGTSLLYSTEFYAAVRRRLAPGGVLQQWIAKKDLDAASVAAFARALRESFPYLRAWDNGLGYHVLAGASPLTGLDVRGLAARLPPAARRDLVELEPGAAPEAVLAHELGAEVSLDALAAAAPRPLTDDRPVNEYDALRRLSPGRP